MSAAIDSKIIFGKGILNTGSIDLLDYTVRILTVSYI